MRLTGRPRPREGANSERGSQPGSCWHTRVSSPDPDAGSVRKAITGFDLQETNRQKGPQVGQLLLQPPEGESDPFLATVPVPGRAVPVLRQQIGKSWAEDEAPRWKNASWNSDTVTAITPLKFDSPCFYCFYFIFLLAAAVCARLSLPLAVPLQTGQLGELEFELEVPRVAF